MATCFSAVLGVGGEGSVAVATEPVDEMVSIKQTRADCFCFQRLSQTAIRRQILGQWASAESPVFVFKQEYSRFRTEWGERFDWDLLRELEGPNAAALDRLRTPLNSTDRECAASTQALEGVSRSR